MFTTQPREPQPYLAPYSQPFPGFPGPMEVIISSINSAGQVLVSALSSAPAWPSLRDQASIFAVQAVLEGGNVEPSKPDQLKTSPVPGIKHAIICQASTLQGPSRFPGVFPIPRQARFPPRTRQNRPETAPNSRTHPRKNRHATTARDTRRESPENQ